MALDVGYRLLDTASSYQNEEAVGRAIKASGVPREELFITTKAYIQQMGYEKTKAAFEESLAKLGLDYLDLYLVHMPFGDYYGAWRAMEELYREGRVRAIGVCNFDSARLMDLCYNAEVRPMVNQIERHPHFQREEELKIMAELGVQPEAWAPFAEGLKGMFTDPVLTEIAAKHGKSVAQVILRWDLQRGAVSYTHLDVYKRQIGSDFQFSVWNILTEIPYGQTTTYGEIARQIAARRGVDRMSAQAVGGAVGHNEISIIVPCHRVVGTNGSLTGYAGGVDKKVRLLTLEGVDMSGLSVPTRDVYKRQPVGTQHEGHLPALVHPNGMAAPGSVPADEKGDLMPADFPLIVVGVLVVHRVAERLVVGEAVIAQLDDGPVGVLIGDGAGQHLLVLPGGGLRKAFGQTGDPPDAQRLRLPRPLAEIEAGVGVEPLHGQPGDPGPGGGVDGHQAAEAHPGRHHQTGRRLERPLPGGARAPAPPVSGGVLQQRGTGAAVVLRKGGLPLLLRLVLLRRLQ